METYYVYYGVASGYRFKWAISKLETINISGNY